MHGIPESGIIFKPARFCMKKRFLLFTAGIGLLLASCGQDYNATPNNTNTNVPNPIAPLGTAGSGQIFFKQWNEKIKLSNCGFAVFGNDRIIAGGGMINGKAETVFISLSPYDSSRKVYSNSDSLMFSLTMADSIGSTNAVVYSNMIPNVKNSMTVNITETNSLNMKGTFSGKLVRVSPSLDTGNVYMISEGSFDVPRK